MVAGEGDFAEDGPQPDTFVDVTELDRSAYLICEIDLYQLSSEIYNHGLNVKDTEIISGMCPEDTIDPNSPLCVNFSYYADESCRDGEFSTSCHDFEGELDYLTGVKDICGGLR